MAAFPITYGECRTRFLEAAAEAGLSCTAHAIEARGPHDEHLTVDVAVSGSERPRRVLVVMSGVHGVEGAPGSVLQTDLIGRLPALHDDEAIVLVHAVNPWGLAWWRRQNEGNVDLNRNWGATPGRIGNEAYGELHDLLCPGTTALPADDEFVAALVTLGQELGLPWVRRAISSGQDTHPDGLYFAGHDEQASTRILRHVAEQHLSGADDLLIVDLHTGHGRWGTATVLSRCPEGSAEDQWLRAAFAGYAFEVSGDGTDGQVVAKHGQLSEGMVDLVGARRGRSVTLELGTRSETTMIVAERAEHWVHHCGTAGHPEHEAVRRHHRRCSAPTDPDWQQNALALGRRALDQVITAQFSND